MMMRRRVSLMGYIILLIVDLSKQCFGIESFIYLYDGKG